jgi:hypothetical protein
LNPALKGKKLFIDRLNPNQNYLRGSAQIFACRNKESRITLGQQMKENCSKTSSVVVRDRLPQKHHRIIA